MTKRTRLLAALLLLALAAAGCVNDAADDGEDEAEAAEATEAPVDEEADLAEEGADEATEAPAEATEEAGSEPAEDAAALDAEVPEGYTHLAAALAGEYEGTSVEILSQWVEAEGENFSATLADFAEATGIDITTEGITDYETVLNVRVEGGDAPDIAQVAQPGLMQEFASAGHLVNLSDWMDVEQLSTDYSEAWTDLTTYEDDTYGVFFRANTKSIVWYPVAAFEEAGYEIPETWDDLIGLQDQILADGGTPWCITMEHGDATGWVATDWIEDVLLRTAEPEVYDQWVAHEIPFDSPEVLAAAEQVGEIWFGEGHVNGGGTAIGATFVGDAMNPTFEEPPGCWLHRQAAWIPDFWPTDPETEEPLYTPGEDAAFFFLPGETPEDRPVLGSGDMFIMFDDRPEVRAVMEYLATADAAMGWIEAGGFISPNSSIPPEAYSDYASSQQAEILADATVLRFDASDSMPAEVGQGSFWSGMVDWVAAEGGNTDQVFADIEASWPS
ncbi:ABC transporter substrate-binding protein [Euzebya sp.]|uniref:ABC transporter substrate-binding protein n=1 Tax=Euzebya sp. TaxID=1971409 RepID=UPI0035126EE2